jgi:hypothetical protein
MAESRPPPGPKPLEPTPDTVKPSREKPDFKWFASGGVRQSYGPDVRAISTPHWTVMTGQETDRMAWCIRWSGEKADMVFLGDQSRPGSEWLFSVG